MGSMGTRITLAGGKELLVKADLEETASMFTGDADLKALENLSDERVYIKPAHVACLESYETGREPPGDAG